MSFVMMVHAIQIALMSDFSCSIATVLQRTAQNFLGVLKTSGGKDRKISQNQSKAYGAYRMSMSIYVSP